MRQHSWTDQIAGLHLGRALTRLSSTHATHSAGGGEEGEEVEYGNDDEEEEVLGESSFFRMSTSV